MNMAKTTNKNQKSMKNRIYVMRNLHYNALKYKMKNFTFDL